MLVKGNHGYFSQGLVKEVSLIIILATFHYSTEKSASIH